MSKRDWRQPTVPLQVRCSGCDHITAISEREMYQFRYGKTVNDWICENGKFTCPTCRKNGAPQDVLTVDQIAELLQQQWNLIYVKYISHNQESFNYEAAGLGTLQTLYIHVLRESSNTYKVSVMNCGKALELGVLQTQRVS